MKSLVTSYKKDGKVLEIYFDPTPKIPGVGQSGIWSASTMIFLETVIHRLLTLIHGKK